MPQSRHRIRPVVQEITQVLRRRIIHRQYPAGVLLPSERTLAGELGVSRMTISRALEQLVDEGIVEQRVGAGSRVCPDAAQRLPPGVVAVLHHVHGQPTPQEMALILQGVLDTLAAGHFACETVPVADAAYSGPIERVVRVQDLPALHNRYGGFLFIEGFAPDAIHALHQKAVPLVVANMENELAVSATWVDHHRIARTAVEMLAALGHRRIGLVATVPGGHAFYGATIQGYQDGLARLGLPSDDHLISLCPTSSPLDAYVAANKLLARAKPRPTAVVAGRDLHAEGIYRAAQERNWVVGRDLSVIGFDDTSWPAATTLLTTFREPCYELGAEAARMLIGQMQQPGKAFVHREIPVPLILRRSAGPPADCAPGNPANAIRLQRLED